MDGRLLALKLNKQFPGYDWIAEIAERAGETRDKVEWHLQEDMDPPAHIERAAQEMLQSFRDTHRFSAAKGSDNA